MSAARDSGTSHPGKWPHAVAVAVPSLPILRHSRTPVAPATDATELHRLAKIARECGIWTFRGPDGAFFCTSATEPGIQHYVSGYACTCRAFTRSQRCIHLAHLLDCLGWLPPLPATKPRPIRRRRLAPILAAAGLVVALLASPATAHEASHRFPGTAAYPHRLTVAEGPTFRVRYLNAGDPRRVAMEDGRAGTLNCRQHTFTITNGPSYVVDC